MKSLKNKNKSVINPKTQKIVKNGQKIRKSQKISKSPFFLLFLVDFFFVKKKYKKMLSF